MPTQQPADFRAEQNAAAVGFARHRKRWAVVCGGLLIVAGWVCGQRLVAQGPANPREYKVKAAYIYNFTRYVSWPNTAFKDAQSPFVIAVVGPDPFGKSIDALRKRKVANRPIVIKRFASMRNYQAAHILFLSFQAPDGERTKALSQTKGKPVLVVGETPKFAGKGAALNFFLDQNGTIGFELNVDTVKRCGVQIDAKLLSIARVVRDGG